MRVLASIVVLLMASPVWARDCETDLKPNATYKELSAKLKCLNDRINALEGIEGTAQKSVPKAKPAFGTQVQEADGFRIELESCSKSGGEIACKLFVSSSRDRNMLIARDSRIVTDDGVSLDLVGYHKAGERDMRRCCVGSYIEVDLVAEARSAGVIYFKSAAIISSDLLATVSMKLANQQGVKFKNIRLISN
jgi:hypothetical protein